MAVIRVARTTAKNKRTMVLSFHYKAVTRRPFCLFLTKRKASGKQKSLRQQRCVVLAFQVTLDSKGPSGFNSAVTWIF